MKIAAFILLTLFQLSVINTSGQWSLSGNAGTTPGTDFLGTTDNQDIIFKRNSYVSGILGSSLTSFGFRGLSSNTTGHSNSAVGVFSLYSNSSGWGNSSLGFQAMYYNTTGATNTGLGSNSLFANTEGSSNTAAGAYSVYGNTTGSYNTGVGFNALYYNSTGGSNTGIGSNALQFTTGSYNTASGDHAGYTNTSGSQNSAFGTNALYYNSIGGSNAAIGYNALQNTTGSNNTGIGASTSTSLTSGSSNTFLGYNTGGGITTGSGNTIIGANVSGLSSGLANTIILADGTGAQKVFIKENGSVGIATTSPSDDVKLDINGNVYTSGKILVNSTLAKAGSFRMAVNGDAIFNRVVVRLYGAWPDYVFDEKYKLTPLKEVEEYIMKYKHLKGVTSAEDISKNGVDVGEAQKVMMEKIEELTLYLIEQNKMIESLKAEVKELKKRN